MSSSKNENELSNPGKNYDTESYNDLDSIPDDNQSKDTSLEMFKDIVESESNESYTKVLEDDQVKRWKEMSSFSAMANSDVDDIIFHEDDDDDDARRRQQEMSAFAALANSNIDDTLIDNDAARRQREMTAFAAMANSDIDNALINDDSARRRKEMNTFAAMANTDVETDHNNSKSIVSNLSPEESSGTFVSGKIASAFESNRNLNAALASLGNDVSIKTIEPPKVEFKPLDDYSQMKQRIPNHKDMYSECIHVAKPLFFGSSIPATLSQAIETKKLKEAQVESFRDEMNRNVESILTAFGYGASSFEDVLNEEEEKSPNNNIITLFEPIWGDRQRLHWEDRVAQENNSLPESEANLEEHDEILAKDDSSSSILEGIEYPSHNDKSLPKQKSHDQILREENDSVKDDQSSLFLQYARGNFDLYDDSLTEDRNSVKSTSESNAVNSNTFLQIPGYNGSFEGSELKKQVGLNDNLSKALKSLSINGMGNASLSAADAGDAAIEASKDFHITVKDGRPLTNLEMANGSVPIYGCDDSPLPAPNDLGIYETKEDQIQSIHLSKSQETIASRAVPNIFGSIVCPSACLGPNDSQGWYSHRSRQHRGAQSHNDVASNLNSNRKTYSVQYSHSRASSNSESLIPNVEDKTDLPSPLPPPPRYAKSSRKIHHKDRETSSSFGQFSSSSDSITQRKSQSDIDDRRIGWWNIQDDFGLKANKDIVNEGYEMLKLPASREATRDDFSWMMYPTQDKVLSENRSFAELHSAVDTIKYIPYLSDRDPLLQHVQIDTQFVGFPTVGEIEPFFCSLAIWNVATTSISSSHNDLSEVKIDFESSGRITESLHFDIVSDPEVEKRCRVALWPYSYQQNAFEVLSPENEAIMFEGTRCGVFPIHSRYDIRNLYAVLIVHKILTDNNELDIYQNHSMNPKFDDGHTRTKIPESDLRKLRERAGKSAERFGPLITPFAFGVAPLVEILGSSPPHIPTSRAAQIPLFRMTAGEGEKPILDHIFAVTNQRGARAPADLIKDGTAMLVIRNFGFLGLHSSIHPHSKLARERLVDFTGELQVRRRRKDESIKNIDNDCGRINAIDIWHKNFIGEPTVNGGRTLNHPIEKVHTDSNTYAQEVAQIPVICKKKPTTTETRAFFHTSFANELFIGPRTILNCTKRNITIKIEIRCLKYSEDRKSLLATIPDSPMIHNMRRGPFLVNESYTSCAYNKIDPQFIDDIKIKLPINLQSQCSFADNTGKLVALFSAYNVGFKSRKKWSLLSAKGDEDEFQYPMELLGCGYLPLSQDDNVACLLADGLHNVKLNYFPIGLANTVEDREAAQEYGSIHSGDGINEDKMSPKILILNQMDTLNTGKNDATLNNNSRDAIILQVQSFSLTSVYSSNMALSNFFDSMPRGPRCMLKKEETFGDVLSETSGNRFEIAERNILGHTIDISNTSTCPTQELVKHFLRVNMHLWRTLVCGTGEPSLLWSNPASIIALRLHTFSCLINILNSMSVYFTKSNLTELDGKGKWNMALTSKIVTMLFDEEKFFVSPPELWTQKNPSLTNDKHLIDDNSKKQCESKEPDKKTPQRLTDSISSLEFDFSNSKLLSNNHTKISSQDDMKLLEFDSKPIPLRARSSSAPNANGLKIDTKIDFQAALNSMTSPNSSSSFGSASLPAANRRKWMTLPSSSLATIQEDNDKMIENQDNSTATDPIDHGDALDTELFKTKTSTVKQFRVPKLKKTSKSTSVESLEEHIFDDDKAPNITMNENQGITKVVPKTDKEIADAGTAFLNDLGKRLGSNNFQSELGGEERRVGISHHRKTRSRCSIDWSLPSTDHLIENYQEMEVFNRHESSLTGPLNKNAESLISNMNTDVKENNLLTSESDDGQQSAFKEDNPTQKQTSIMDVQDNEYFELPAYHNRNIAIQKCNCGRWFPYTYEVIIFQWAAVLSQQTKKRQSKSSRFVPMSSYEGTDSTATVTVLKEAAHKSRGVSIACAPILFEIIKKSIGFRIDSVFRTTNSNDSMSPPPLVSLDKTLISTLEFLISTITDACIDSRNFDSWSFRQTSIVVNDAIARFVRDMFAYFQTDVAHRLVLTYFQRFASKDGKQWQDRDSKIGLRCSWEICKLRLNAITLFIRFADFIKVNKPLMETWGPWSLRAPNKSTSILFSKALKDLEELEMSTFAVDTPLSRDDDVKIPQFKSHWLVELTIDICLAATGHVEHDIQHRAAALLYELFWSTSLEGKFNGSLTVLTSMYVPFIVKILSHVRFLSNLPPKSQLRKNLLSCVIFVIQSAPLGLLRALWRKLCLLSSGINIDRHGGLHSFLCHIHAHDTNKAEDSNIDTSYVESSSQNILDLCSLLNLCLKTFEYEGSDSNFEEEFGVTSNERLIQWQQEFLLAIEDNKKRQYDRHKSVDTKQYDSKKFTSTNSRKWFSHDGAIVMINACRNVVGEYLSMLRPLHVSYTSMSGPVTNESSGIKNKVVSADHNKQMYSGRIDDIEEFTYTEKVTFVRAISSVYLNCLSLRQSDIVYIKTLIASIEILKAFGIELFLASVGETLQHWMRVILVHCGARRAKVRVEASDFLALLLRLTWDSYGNICRVRVPLLAVQTEVMERIVATAAARYYREQRRLKVQVEYLSNECAEAALTPLWRTLHRLHHSSASNNAAFKSALELLASRMKILYKAYIAAHALAIVTRTNASPIPMSKKRITKSDHLNLFQVKRVVLESAGFSKKILGHQGVSSQENTVTHSEVVQDSFLAAAYVFSPTELPLHRIAWLRKLADFHSSCQRYAEEGECHLKIHQTLRQAALLHEHLWSSVPFFPWASDSSDGVHLNGEGPAGSAGILDPAEFEDRSSTSFVYEDADQSFRRIFYRVANSVRMRTGDWDVGGNKTLFYGVTFASEFNGSSQWISLREIEQDMVDEAELAGELFLQAGLVESSRFCWSLATQFYSEIFNYAKLSHCYRKLAHVVASKVPVLDTSNQLEISSPFGRFYRVHFHGGAADELMGKEFVYRAAVSVKLEEFCNNLCMVLTSILPEKTPINLVLDDGRPQGQVRSTPRRPLGPTPREPITIKVTPLKPLLQFPCPRGTSEWFYRQTEIPGFSAMTSKPFHPTILSHEYNTHFDTISRTRSSLVSTVSTKTSRFGRPSNNYQTPKSADQNEVDPVLGVKKFSFTQSRDRLRGGRDILKTQNGSVFEKSLRVTELLVDRSLPNCVTRQAVIQRTVFNQSPLEAAIEVVCSWCAVLFRTAVATNGLAVIGSNVEQGIGNRAEKVIADCIHKSRVKEIGKTMLKTTDNDDSSTGIMALYEKLSTDEIEKNQNRLARAIVMFMELLLVLIGWNRDLLLADLEQRKRRDASSTGSISGRVPPQSPGQLSSSSDYAARGFDDGTDSMGFGGASGSSTIDRTEKAMAIQRELQKSFISMNKLLQPIISSIIHSETPRWMKYCCQDSYFSSSSYRQAKIAIGEEVRVFPTNLSLDSYDNFHEQL